MSFCRVCNTELKQKYSECPYCGYNNKVVLTVSNDDSEEYRLNLLKSINQISIRENIFRYSEKRNAMEMIGHIALFDGDLDGVKCSGKDIVSNEWIAHFAGKHDLMVNYVVRSKFKSVIASIELDEDDSEATFDVTDVGEWHLVLHLDDDFRLKIGIQLSKKEDEKSDIWWLNTVDLDLTA